MRKSFLTLLLSCFVAVMTAFSMTACSGSGSSDGQSGGEDAATKADLEEARQTVLKYLDEKGDMPQIYLADDVSSPEQKYGMWVVPYTHSEATEKTTSVVAIEKGKFEIEGIAAESQKTWVIDQDGKITEQES